MFVSVTRLRLRRARFFVPFVWDTMRVRAQALEAQGCLASKVRRTRGGVYWTLTSWRDEAAMRAFMTSGAHFKAMPKLLHWCDEASLTHWTQDDGDVAWREAERRLAIQGRTSKVRYPSPAHAAGKTLGSDA